MYELIKLSENDYYVDCPAKIGIIKIAADKVIAIDSGSDKDAGKKVMRHLEENKWTLTAIFNTHSHADHIGGNKLLQERTGCKIYAPGLECCFTNNPILEPINLYGGYPFTELKHKFLFAQESSATRLTPDVLPEGFEIIPLPGHSFDMVGFKTPDGNIFLADCLSSKETLEKYGLGYLWDVEAYLSTLEQVKQFSAKQFIPSHAPVTTDINSLAQFNIDWTNSIISKILELIKTPLTFEALLQKLFTAYNLTMSAQQYVLIGSTLRSYLAYLKNKGLAEFRFEDNCMVWEGVK